MKNIRKLMSFLLIAVMLCAMSVTAFAAQTETVNTGEGSITISNATVGETYAIYKIFDATYDAEDGHVSYTYTIPEGKTAETDDIFQLLTATGDNGSPFTLTQVLDTKTYVVSAVSANHVAPWLANNKSSFTAVKSVEATDSELKFDKLAYGYYFITSTLDTTLTITHNTPDAVVIDKNQGPSWNVDEEGSGKVIVEKELDCKDSDPDNHDHTDACYKDKYVKLNAVNIGDTVDFKISINTTNYNGSHPIVEYYINDTIAKGFEYNKDSVKVKIGTTELTAATAENAVVGTNYIIAWDDANNSFKITVPWYDTDTKAFASSDANNTLSVTYSATMQANDDTVYAGSGNKNRSTFDFKDTSDPDDPGNDPYHTVEEKETTTYTFALALKKIDATTKEVLTGAEFKIKTSDGKYLTATGSAGEYVYSGTVDDADSATTFTTDSNGVLVVRGVAAGSYKIVETKAPSGYNLLTYEKDIEATLASVSNYKTTYTHYYDADGNLIETSEGADKTVTTTYPVNVSEVIVENGQGTVLPTTGGIGTTIFYVLGGLLAVGAAILLVVKRRMSFEN